MFEEETHVDDSPVANFFSAANRDALNAFTELRSAILTKGSLSSKEKILIALTCSVSIKCEPCTENYTKEALKNAIKMKEILEASSIAGLICGGAGFAFASRVMEVEE